MHLTTCACLITPQEDSYASWHFLTELTEGGALKSWESNHQEGEVSQSGEKKMVHFEAI